MVYVFCMLDDNLLQSIGPLCRSLSDVTSPLQLAGRVNVSVPPSLSLWTRAPETWRLGISRGAADSSSDSDQKHAEVKVSYFFLFVCFVLTLLCSYYDVRARELVIGQCVDCSAELIHCKFDSVCSACDSWLEPNLIISLRIVHFLVCLSTCRCC